MKAYELQQFGLTGFQRVERDVPEPGPGQVRLRMSAASLNYHDLATAMGMANPRMKLPVVPLSDGCGVVDAVGAGVSRVKVGDRVTTTFFPAWLSGRPTRERLTGVPGEHIDGCLQEFMLLGQDSVVAVPAHLSDVEAATLPCAALTAWRSIVVEGQVKAGDRVLLQGSGGVSIFALQFCRMLGAEVIMTTSSADKAERLLDLGAHHIINYREHPEWSRRVRELTGGEGVDHVVEVGGSGTFNQSLRSIRIGGHVSMIGVLTGVADVIPTALIMSLNATVKGITVGSREDFESMNRAIAVAGIKPVIGQTLAFDEAVDAYRLMQEAGHFGKICLRI